MISVKPVRTLIRFIIFLFIVYSVYTIDYYGNTDIESQIQPIPHQRSTGTTQLVFKYDRLKILLSSQKYKEYRLKVRNYDQWDKRLLPLYWLYLINHADGVLDKDFKLPFNWNLITNMQEHIKDNSNIYKIAKKKYSCAKFFKMEKHLPKNFDIYQHCQDDPNFDNPYKLPFHITKWLNVNFEDYQFRQMFDMLYSLESFPTPKNVILLNANDRQTVMVPLKTVSMGDNDLVKPLQSYYTNISNHIIDIELEKNSSISIEQILLNGVSIPNELAKFTPKAPMMTPYEYNIEGPVIIQNVNHSRTPTEQLPLDKSLFNWYLPEEVAKLDTNSPLFEYLARQLEIYQEEKYFGNPNVKEYSLSHYDWRFYKEDIDKTNPDLHRSILHRLSRTWFAFCSQFDVPTWLNHGPLIGWYWNGMAMPFDADLDVQLPIQSLHRMLKFLNDSLIYDFSGSSRRYVNLETKVDNFAELGMRSFYFEINNNYPRRNGYYLNDNNIDARLIDTETGVYIDITLLSFFQQGNQYNDFLEFEILKSMSSAQKERFYKGALYDELYYKMSFQPAEKYKYKEIGRALKDFAHDVIHDYEDYFRTPEGHVPMINMSELLTDRNYHSYQYKDFHKLVPVQFESHPLYLPQNYLQNIVKEYGRDLIQNKYFMYHRFFPQLSLWVSHDDCPFYNEITGLLEEGESEEGIAQKCVMTNKKVRDTFNQILKYAPNHNQLRNVVFDDANVVEPRIDLDKLEKALLQFDSNVLIPEVWSRDLLFDKDKPIEGEEVEY